MDPPEYIRQAIPLGAASDLSLVPVPVRSRIAYPSMPTHNV